MSEKSIFGFSFLSQISSKDAWCAKCARWHPPGSSLLFPAVEVDPLGGGGVAKAMPWPLGLGLRWPLAGGLLHRGLQPPRDERPSQGPDPTPVPLVPPSRLIVRSLYPPPSYSALSSPSQCPEPSPLGQAPGGIFPRLRRPPPHTSRGGAFVPESALA